MSTEALNRIIKEAKALTPDERRELIDWLAREEQNSQEHIVHRPGTLKGTIEYTSRDFDSTFSNFDTSTMDTRADAATLRDWLTEARIIRSELPLTTESETY